MKTTFKKGDKVRCTVHYCNRHFGDADSYEVMDTSGVYGGTRKIQLCDDENGMLFWDASIFKLVNKQDFNDALNLIGTYVINPDGKKTIIKSASVWSKFYSTTDERINEIIKEYGYCVMVEDDKEAYVFMDVETISNVVELTDDYNAVIEGDNVVVGCQTIPISKVEQILTTWKQLQ